MAKRLFLLAAGALALTACTSEDVVDDVAATRNVIQFENVVNKHTRVVDLSSSTLKKFNVFGFYTLPGNPNHADKVFHNVPIEDKEGNGKWTYVNSSDARHWVENAKYYFYAYSCGSVSSLSESYGKFDLDMSNEIDPSNPDDTEGGKPAEDRVLTITGYQCDSDHQHDLVFASNTEITGKATMNSSVSFQFSHILSKIKAKFTNSMPSEYDIKIRDVAVRNIRNVGDYNFKGASNISSAEEFVSGWSNVQRKAGSPIVILQNTEATKDADPPIVVLNGESGESGEAYVIPMQYEQKDVYLYFVVDIYIGDDLVMSKPLSASIQPDWRDGHAYVYNVTISVDDLNLEEITFTTSTSLIDWLSGGTVDADVD